jgi:hypothetical protein
MYHPASRRYVVWILTAPQTRKQFPVQYQISFHSRFRRHLKSGKGSYGTPRQLCDFVKSNPEQLGQSHREWHSARGGWAVGCLPTAKRTWNCIQFHWHTCRQRNQSWRVICFITSLLAERWSCYTVRRLVSFCLSLQSLVFTRSDFVRLL